MLNTEERKNQLEELLARVRRNRSYLEAARVGRDAADDHLAPSEPELELSGLPIPVEPPPVARPLSESPRPAEVPTVVADTAYDQLIVPTEAADLEEAASLPDVVVSETQRSEPPPASVPAETADGFEAPVSAVPAPVIAASAADAADVAEVIEVIDEAIPKVIEATIPAPVEAFASFDREPEMAAISQVAPPPPLQVQTFEAPSQASANVVAVRGELGDEWSLSAVLARAWRVGSLK